MPVVCPNLLPPYRFLVKFLTDGLKLLGLILHLLALLIIVDSKLLQSLENLLDLVLGGLVLCLQAIQFCLQVLMVTARRSQKLQVKEKGVAGIISLIDLPIKTNYFSTIE